MHRANEQVCGKCSICGGIVTVATIWWSVVPPVPTCQKCGAVQDTTSNLPIVPMKGHRPEVPPLRWRTKREPWVENIYKRDHMKSLYETHII